ncbi:glycosyl transferase, group 1 [Magnetococcus marinus MC-1]|uniref:Glycosyl transferase, group 1 n=1 Tax=Magnetococcus marinus (strain ATCC BAA-1437 / JCM 17883 / MC-1) TaxID=156889 RepID=A0L4M4_MAGMM|nr:glycosyltransferase family 4 protein [Magnetococcus marinus]ABK42917.1 glycosyl transferase, group 1 [Magnetococcus marinus MC-1]
MRLSFLCHEFPPTGGGAASALDHFTRVLVKRGHRVQILTIGLGAKTLRETLDERQIIRYGVGRRSMLSPTTTELLRSYWALRHRSKRDLAEFKPDCSVAFFAFPAGHALLKQRRRLTGPMAVSIRGSDIPGFSKKRWGLFQWLQPWLVRPVLEGADRVFANGETLATLTRAFAPHIAVTSIPNGVDTQQFSPADRAVGAHDGPLRVLSVGQLIPRKQVALLLAGAALLQRPLEITLAGSGPLEEPLKAQAAQLPPPIKVHFCGHTQREAMPQLYRAHDLLVHLSGAEGVSNVALEALASGLPLLATPQALGPEFVGSRGVMVLHDPNEAALAEALLTLDSQRQRLGQMGHEARHFAERFDWQRAAAQFEAQMSRLWLA